MALYEYSWLILLSPLFAFAVIIFGTRMWDLATRGHVAATAAHEIEAHAGHNGHDESDGDIELMHEKGPGGEDLVFEDIEDPKVPQLTMGAQVSGYLSVVIMGLACIYSWILLLNTAGTISIAPMLPTQGISLTQISYAWCQNIDATNNCFGLGSYLIAFHLDYLTIVMLVVVTTVTLLVQYYSQGYMERSAGYARFFAYLSLFAFSMLMIVFACVVTTSHGRPYTCQRTNPRGNDGRGRRIYGWAHLVHICSRRSTCFPGCRLDWRNFGYFCCVYCPGTDRL